MWAIPDHSCSDSDTVGALLPDTLIGAVAVAGTPPFSARLPAQGPIKPGQQVLPLIDVSAPRNPTSPLTASGTRYTILKLVITIEINWLCVWLAMEMRSYWLCIFLYGSFTVKPKLQ
jgi:hypothetical protein